MISLKTKSNLCTTRFVLVLMSAKYPFSPRLLLPSLLSHVWILLFLRHISHAFLYEEIHLFRHSLIHQKCVEYLGYILATGLAWRIQRQTKRSLCLRELRLKWVLNVVGTMTAVAQRIQEQSQIENILSIWQMRRLGPRVDKIRLS